MNKPLHDITLQLGQGNKLCEARWQLQEEIIKMLKNTELGYELNEVTLDVTDPKGVRHRYCIAIMEWGQNVNR